MIPSDVINANVNTATLAGDGIEVVRVITPELVSTMGPWFRQTELAFPEFTKDTAVRVLGGFAAYGNPSSFHNSFVKMLRKTALRAVLKQDVFGRFLRATGRSVEEHRLEVLLDRMMRRHAGQSPSRELAHRDVTPAKDTVEGDLMFGGWINLTNTFQYFVGKPGSHRDVAGEAVGFYKLTESAIALEYLPHRRAYRIDPGQMVVFAQNLVHEVLAGKDTHDQLRLFTGWRLTRGDSLLFEDEKKLAVSTLGVPRLPSGQLPVMYSPNHGSAFLEKPFRPRNRNGETTSLLEWLQASFVDEVKQRFTGERKVMRNRSMLSLVEYNLACDGHYYDDEDKAVLLRLHVLQIL
jgi:hypothetical protein